MRDTDFYITQLDQLKTDPAKSNLWRVIIPNSVFDSANDNGYKITNFGENFTEDDFKLHVQSVGQLPAPKLKMGQIDYFGLQKEFVAGTEKLNGSLKFTAILSEDMRAYQAILNWKETAFKAGILDQGNDNSREALTGLSKSRDSIDQVGSNAVLNEDVKVQLYNLYEHAPILSLTLVNAIPTEVSIESQLGYKNASLMTFTFTLIFDRYKYKFYNTDGQA